MIKKLKEPLLLITVLLAFSLRLQNIGYSNYQGDEIKALFLPDPGQSMSSFFLDQRKGPMQFIVTFLLKLVNPTYTNEFFVRLPFALAGAFAVLFFYKLLKDRFGEKIAFYASFFFATNGFFVALSRIVQYQAFVMFFMVLALHMFSLAVKQEKWKIKGIYLGFLFWALSILSHYDGVFIAPFAFYLLGVWFSQNKNLAKHLFGAGALAGLLLAVFYVPFVLSISIATKDYWLNRLSGGNGKISSSRYLFQVYNPIYIIHIYNILSVFGLLALRKKSLQLLIVFIWFALPFVFLEFIVNIPGTHVFIYLLPLTIILAHGIVEVEAAGKWIFDKLKLNTKLIYAGISIIFAFIFLQSYFIFVDHTYEYPWENERFMLWTFHKPSAMFHLSMFGFPYFRNWEKIEQVVTQDSMENRILFYSTNERQTISRYYIPFQKDADRAGYYIYIESPQSFTDQIVSDKAAYWAQNHEPIYVGKSTSATSVKIYYMPNLTLDELKLQGY